ncbi:acyl-coenzyme A thioesterase 1 [Denticeps clupeoides]|uniref:Uncharacterized protein n=1 Tax=Denticeps clupeoides TaxID=299321 RepID=A0AAY4BVI7_9TELE|nr:acyl-coenzyme A thioesterase 1-like [Denticeps clupeoides]
MALLRKVPRRLLLRVASVRGYAAALRLLPGASCLFDEPVHVKVEGLSPGRNVELRSQLTDDRGVTFRASATYRADQSGVVDVARSPSLGGTYSGPGSMGLLWSMEPTVAHTRLTKRDASKPLLVDVEVVGDGRTLARATNERRFMADGVRRVAVKAGRIRGTMFVPPGPGPFPAVLDLYTFGGGLVEHRASLLASKGFVVLALAMYNYQDLPKVVNKFHLEYFEEAVEFLRTSPEVKGPGIGIISISKSGDIALSMASFLPGVSATVSINGCNACTVFPLHYKDKVIPPLKVDLKKVVIRGDGILDIRDVLHDPTSEDNLASVIPIERANGQFLFAASEDDRNWNSYLFLDQAVQRLKDHGKDNFEVVKYAKAGHFLDTPYMPLCLSTMHAAVGKVVAFGGDPQVHAEAQVDLWKRVQEFFNKHLA